MLAWPNLRATLAIEHQQTKVVMHGYGEVHDRNYRDIRIPAISR
jgi:hypothetical protein